MELIKNTLNIGLEKPVKLLHVTMRKDGLFGFLVGIALKRYLTDIKPKESTNPWA